MMKKLKLLALLIFPLFLAIIIPTNVDAASSGCGYVTFSQYPVLASGDYNKDVKETVRSPKLCISNLDDNGNITDKSELTKTSQGWDLFDFLLMNKKQTKLICNEKTFLGINAQCSDTTYSLDDLVGQNYILFFNHFESPIKSYYNKGNNLTVRDNVNGQTVAYEYQNVVSEALNATTDPDNPEGENPGGSEEDNPEGGENGENQEEEKDLDEACYESGIDSMGWLVCPTINNASQTADGIMGIITDTFQIKPDQIFGGDVDVTRNTWEVFRSIANVVVTIILIVIIISQITGYGIDNYGIKKALPRLIAVAILINFSYIICQIVVDISNILGQGLYELFRNIAEGSGVSFDHNVPIILAGAAGVIIAIITAASAAYMGVAAILSIVLAVLMALVSLFLFFVMLAVRQMAVVVLVIISPLAFACCILPNTQNFFNKWWKILEACIILYPICGALYGVSYIIVALAQNSGDFVWQIISICAPFLPFLAAPVLLKNAIAGLGVIGGAVTTLTSGARNIARTGVGAAKKTDTFKGIQERDRQRNNLRKAGVDENFETTRAGERKVRRANSRIGRFFGLDKNLDMYTRRAKEDIEKNRPEFNYSNEETRERARTQMEAKFQEADKQAVLTDMAAGKIDGVDINDRPTIEKFHKDQLAEADRAQKIIDSDTATAADKAKAEADLKKANTNVRAAQEKLVASRGGRAAMYQNLEDAVREGKTGGLQEATSDLLQNYNDTITTSGRGKEQFIRDLATYKSKADTTPAAAFQAVQSNLQTKAYDTTDIGKYSANSLSRADEVTLRGFAAAMDDPNINLSDNDYDNLINMAQSIKVDKDLSHNLSEESQGYIDAIANHQRRVVDNQPHGDRTPGTERVNRGDQRQREREARRRLNGGGGPTPR